ncbi:MAG TPA: hypothetical protein PK718_02580 [Candidatus Methanofastidiosa archaeon]|nr:hypothetical protein [Candidatus Methanofastidiosa archaeon]
MVEDNKNYDYVDRAMDEKSLFEKVSNYIPGYRGYADQEKVRNTDILVRQNVAKVLRESYNNISEVFDLMATGDKNIVTVDKINLKLDALEQKISHAESGYSPMFDPIKVGDKALERLVEFDAELLDITKAILEKTNDLKTQVLNNESEEELSRELYVLIGELESTFSNRSNYMLELPE